nr:hypothetical protein [uncultured bacterium]
MPSSLTMNHSSTLGYSPWLPVSVCGTGRYTRFSWKPLHAFASPRRLGSTCYSVST